jgi:ribosomal protein L10
LALNAEQKRERVAEYIDLLKRSQCVVLAEFGGLAMPGMNLLRSRVREAEGVVRVTKNTLIQIAFKEVGLPIPGEPMAGSTLVPSWIRPRRWRRSRSKAGCSAAAF